MAQPPAPAQPDPASAMAAALHLSATGNLEQACHLLEDVLATKSLFMYAFEQLLDDVPPVTIQADLLARGFGADLVETPLQQALASFSDNFAAQMAAGKILLHKEAPQRAEEKFRRAIALDPQHAQVGEAWELLGWSLLNQGRYTNIEK